MTEAENVAQITSTPEGRAQYEAAVKWDYSTIVMVPDEFGNPYPTRTITNKERAAYIRENFPLVHMLEPSERDPWYKQSAGKAFLIGAGAIATGVGAAALWGGPGIAAETAGEAFVSESAIPEAIIPGSLPAPASGGATALVTEETVLSDLAAYDAAIAEGAASGVGLVPTVKTAGEGLGIWDSIKSGAEWLGLGAIVKGIGTTAGQLAGTSLTTSIFGGEAAMPGAAGAGGSSTYGGSSEGGFFSGSMLPWILIGVTLIGAFILTRKRGR